MALQIIGLARPDSDALVRRLAAGVDARMLATISEWDYGHGVEAHLAGLKRIRDDGIVDAPLRWEPREVLELCRWHEPQPPEATDRSDALAGLRGHRARAFACAALIRAYGDRETREICDGYCSTIVQLLDSLRALDIRCEREAMAAVGWFLERLRTSGEDVEDEITFAGLALLWLALRSEPAVAPGAIGELAHWLIAQEQRAFDCWGHGVGDHPGHWLLRTTHFTQRSEKWIELGRELADYRSADDHGDMVRDVGRRLAGLRV